MSGLLAGMGPEGAALALLVLGHVLADFAFQSTWMVDGKPAPAPLFAHGLVVFTTHAIVLAPMLTPYTALLVLGVALAHVLVDAVKAHRETGEASLGLFLGDQATHLLVLLVAWTLIPSSAWTSSALVLAADGLPYQAWTILSTGAIYLSAFVFAHHGGNAIVRGTLPPGPEADDEDDLSAGRLIGTLERVLVLVLVLAGQWSAIAIVVGAKSIARYQKLREQPFAEYFLVGTLASILVAVALGLSVQALV